MRSLIFLCLCLFSFKALALTKGFNQAWMKNDYGVQWLDGYYDPQYAEELILLNKHNDSKLLRMWLFEGRHLTQFTQENGQLKLKPEFLSNLEHFLQLAQKHQVKINLTFLDGNAYKNLSQTPELLDFWWNVFNDRYGGLDKFKVAAVYPVYALIRKFPQTVTQIDIMNEVNALFHFQMFSHESKLKHFTCKMKQGSPVPVTASLGWGNVEEAFFSGILQNACMDFFELHFYNDQGTIPRCSDFKKYASRGVQLQLGEFGQLSRAYDDQLQSTVTQNFLSNAKKCGFTSALAWRLEDSRDGHNTEARYSYISFDRPRPAMEVFKNH